VPDGKDDAYAIYTAPSPDTRLATPGSFGLSRKVETSFFPDRSFDLTAFDPKTFPLPTGTAPKAITAKCTQLDTAEGTKPARLTNEKKYDFQIDWGPHKILQNDKLVGYVDVTPHIERGGTIVRAHENWMLFISGFPNETTYGSYLPPSSSGGSYVVEFLDLKTPTQPAASLIPADTVYESILAECDVPTR